MKTQIAERLNTITAQNGFVPFVSRVSVIGQEQGENHVAAWREGARNLSVAVVDDESGACAVLIQATGESEEALRRHIDVVLRRRLSSRHSGSRFASLGCSGSRRHCTRGK